MTSPDTTEDEVAASPEPPPQELLHGAPVSRSRGQDVLFAPRDRYLEILRALRDDGFVMCVDVTVVDHLTNDRRRLPDAVEKERYEVVVNLVSLQDRRRLRVRVQVPAEDPVVPSLFELWPGTEALEREAWDLFGVRFDGHPDLTRILMPDDWEGHPLRKDYAVGRIPVQFKGAPQPR